MIIKSNDLIHILQLKMLILKNILNDKVFEVPVICVWYLPKVSSGEQSTTGTVELFPAPPSASDPVPTPASPKTGIILHDKSIIIYVF